MGLFVYTQKGSIISMVDLPTTEIIEPSFVRRVSSPLPFSGHKSSADLSMYEQKKFCTTIWSKLCYILTKLFGNLLKILKNPFKCTFFLIY